MKNLSCALLLVSLVLTTFSSCDKEKFDPLVQNSNPTSSILKSVIFSGAGVSGKSCYLSYNEDYLVSEIKDCFWDTYSSSNGASGIFHDTTTYTFEYSNKLCIRCDVRNRNTPDIYYIFQYDKYGRIKTRIDYDGRDNSESLSTSYLYDKRGNLIEQISLKNGTPVYSAVMAYNSSDNMISIISYDLTKFQTMEKREYTSFDNHVNLTKTINGLPIDAPWQPKYKRSSPNNYLESRSYPAVDIHQPFGQAKDDPCPIHEYNEEGLPSRQTLGVQTITYTYEKYK